MKKSNILISSAICALFLVLFSGLHAQVPFNETGMKSFDDWNPDKTGNTLVSQKLSDAISWCTANHKVLYIPPGTYLVDKKFICWNEKGNTNTDDHPYIVGNAFNRPVIKLKDNTWNSDKAWDGGTPIFELLMTQSDIEDKAPWKYWATIQNVDFDMGQNKGAVAIKWNSAQDASLRNIRITGNEFHAGVYGNVGANQANINIEVIGGKYGIIAAQSAGATLTGIKLRNQTVAGIYSRTARSITFIGIDYEGNAPGIDSDNPGYSTYETGHTYILDCKFKINNSSNPAIRAGDRIMIMRNVYVKGTNDLCDNRDLNVQGTTNNWTWVKTFSHAYGSLDGRDTYHHLNGTAHKNHTISDYATGATVPSDIMTKHLPDEIYAWNHPDAVNAFNFPGSTKRAQIQNAIDNSPSGTVIFIPPGIHDIDNTIVLKSGRILIGDPGKLTKLNPTYSGQSSHKYVVETDNTTGYCVIQDLYAHTHDNDFEGGFRWRAASGFMLNVRNFDGFGNAEKNVRAYAFEGNAGGKFYAITDHRNINVDNPSSSLFRKVYIRNTSNPITFYGCNIERGGSHKFKPLNPFIEITDAQNIRILGMKMEIDEGVFIKIKNSDNICLTSLFTHRPSNHPVIDLNSGSDNIEIGPLGVGDNQGAGENLIQQYSNLKHNDLLVLLRKGNFDHGAFDAGVSPTGYPVADAGPDKTIVLPDDSVSLDGSDSYDNDGNISSYAWQQTSGPSCNLNGHNTAILSVTNLVEGIYVFQLTVTDDSTLTNTDDVIVYTVAPEFYLKVNNGTGSGSYAAGSIVDITANTPPTGTIFDRWSGDVANVANVDSAKTTIILNENATITAFYKIITGLDSILKLHSNILYPNPAEGQFTLKMTCNEPYNVTLINLKGEIERKWQKLTGNTTLDCSQHPQGIYILQIQGDKLMIHKKLILVD